MGECVRYDGKSMPLENEILIKWLQQGCIVTCCPEVAGGLSVPRPCAEIMGGNGDVVLKGDAGVRNIDGEDVTKNFLTGAKHAFRLVHSNHIKYAILKDGSPSCGSTYVYDGSFSKIKRPGKGVTTVLLEKHGVRVFSELNISCEMIPSFSPGCKKDIK